MASGKQALWWRVCVAWHEQIWDDAFSQLASPAAHRGGKQNMLGLSEETVI